MKMLFIFPCLFSLFVYYTCNTNEASVVQVTKSESKLLTDTINFSAQVQPILVKKCSPCHFPGGKMYDRLPFDKDTTILNHETGILKRIKGEEGFVIKTFIEQNKNGLSTDKLSKKLN